MSESRVVRVAVPTPLRRAFDYLAPTGAPLAGARVRIPFGRRETVGVVLGATTEPGVAPHKLKRISAVLDEVPLLDGQSLAFLEWAADYYHHPIGEVLQTALPVLLRQGAPATVAGLEQWSLTVAGRALAVDTWKRAPRQRRLWEALAATPGLSAGALGGLSPGWRPLLAQWAERGWARVEHGDCLSVNAGPPVASPALTASQAQAVSALVGADTYRAFLLHGITGSGKTEVYLQAIARVLAAGRQALVLVPEIGLTPQLVDRFRRRFSVPIAVLHSGLNDSERLCAWLAARAGRAPIVLGTRSAVFTPLARPGLIVVDEEHDLSYKQQDGFRYHARDLAVVRAHRDDIPIVLGSATPSLESLHNVRQGRYALLELPERPGAAALPQVHLLDLRRLPLIEGLAQPLLKHLDDRLERREQSLVFLNRRGFAPVYMCYDCRWIASCTRCDAHMTLHRDVRVSREPPTGRQTPHAASRERPPRHTALLCHHCGAEQRVPARCPACASERLEGIGEGTQRVEAVLARHFPRARIVRIDRDSTRRKGALQGQLERIQAGEADILVGTQMLSKGHDFPNVTLVAVLNADQGLYSSDFRSPEHLFQQILQVGGRAGRAERPGEVMIQTFYPDHALFMALIDHDYHAFAEHALAERRDAGYPPFGYLALLRAEAPATSAALAFLGHAHRLAQPLMPERGVQLMDPVASPMERRAGRYRAQLLVQASQRGALHEFIRKWLSVLDTDPAAKRVRWSLDIDPVMLF
jgi:primosomal protein N' (replication factor Y)